MRMPIILAGTLALAGCASTHPITPVTAADQSVFARAEVVRVTLTNFKFAPETIELQAGRPYRIEIVNQAGGGHNFAAPEFFAASKLAAGDAAEVADGAIEFAGGETKTLSLVPVAGEYRLVCTHTGHAALGMAGKIVVR
jgi:plastocyanin